ncbi:Thermostable carboxypeptidase 1 [Chlamydiales bacterium SCGC AG-110-P3]|nr:Thermostable carboxypeptidase 1 [Chlamydiales bacterium SCGC AG-110-P3]
MVAANKDYTNVHKLGKEAALIEGISGLLGWDQETMMPQGALQIRSEQQAFLAELQHKKMTGAPFRRALEKLIDLETGNVIAQGLTACQEASLRRWRRDYQRSNALPKSFVSQFAKLTANAKDHWKQARETNCYSNFHPYLGKIIDMCRKKADLIGYNDQPYDALLDEYEPEMTTAQVTALFDEIRAPVTALVKQIGSAKQVNDSILYGDFPVDKQMGFVNRILKDIGYDSKYGRIDLSAHPFSSSCHPTDNRITTRVSTKHFHHNILAAMHEAGHSLYEMGLPIEAFGSPLGQAISLGVHESQSRWWETRIGQTRDFWIHYLPVLGSMLNESFASLDIDTFYRAINKVAPTMIRVEADEVTYPLHVMLRFEIEVALIEGTLSVKDLPDAWNEKMEHYLGIIPQTPSEGCLQDIHWSMGAFGYFPTYSIGNIFCAQMFLTFEQEHSDWKNRIAQGQFTFVLDWLRKNIHQHGRRYNGTELVEKVSGRPFTAKPYLEYLQQKYGAIYDL